GADTLHNIAAGIYTVQVSGNNGMCGYREDTVHVSGPAPVVPVAAVTSAVCANTTDGEIQILQLTGGAAPYQLLWPDGSQADSLAGIAAGTYSLQITDANGCVTSEQITVPALYNVQSVFNLNTDTLDITYSLVTSNYSTGASTYLWNFGDGGQSTLVNPSYYYNQPGDYTVTLTSTAATCTDSASLFLHVYNATGIEETTAAAIQIMNSPGALLINFNTPIPGEANIRVYDNSGRILAEQQHPASGIAAVNMLTQASGIYIVQITVNNEIVKTAKVFLLKQ
ncbi:MAG: T9SS type A sorting domain-containing protein, partial [Bacteroidia bacterium]